jgi:hypothetical protein
MRRWYCQPHCRRIGRACRGLHAVTWPRRCRLLPRRLLGSNAQLSCVLMPQSQHVCPLPQLAPARARLALPRGCCLLRCRLQRFVWLGCAAQLQHCNALLPQRCRCCQGCCCSHCCFCFCCPGFRVSCSSCLEHRGRLQGLWRSRCSVPSIGNSGSSGICHSCLLRGSCMRIRPAPGQHGDIPSAIGSCSGRLRLHVGSMLQPRNREHTVSLSAAVSTHRNSSAIAHSHVRCSRHGGTCPAAGLACWYC